MENNIEVIENIMKPYLEKKEQIEKSKTQSNVEINALKLRLERLLDNKEREIEEYISEAVNSSSNFYSGYGAMIRKDLELAYKEKEDEIRKEIAKLEQIPNYERVDLRELVEVKHDLRKQLYVEQKRLNYELKKEQINFDTIMLDLDAFKYEYNDQGQVTNGSAWRELYEKSNEIADRIRNLRDALKKIEECFKETEITKDEGTAILRSMTPLEKEEYDRRKAVVTTKESIETAEEIFEDTKKQIDEFAKDEIDATEIDPIEPIDFQKNLDQEDIIEINDPIISDNRIEEGNIIADSHADLLLTIYNDIIGETQKLRSVSLNSSKGKLEENEYYLSTKEKYGKYNIQGLANLSTEEESLKLPCGEYINISDINAAIDNLYKKEKGRSYNVTETNSIYKITKRTIAKFKRKLKNCCTLKLVKDKKLSKLDLFKVFGKEKSESIFRSAEQYEIGSLESQNIPEGDYVSRDDLIISMRHLFKERAASWLEKLTNRLKNEEEQIERNNATPEEEVEQPNIADEIEIDDEFVVKK